MNESRLAFVLFSLNKEREFFTPFGWRIDAKRNEMRVTLEIRGKSALRYLTPSRHTSLFTLKLTAISQASNSLNGMFFFSRNQVKPTHVHVTMDIGV